VLQPGHGAPGVEVRAEVPSLYDGLPEAQHLKIRDDAMEELERRPRLLEEGRVRSRRSPERRDELGPLGEVPIKELVRRLMDQLIAHLRRAVVEPRQHEPGELARREGLEHARRFVEAGDEAHISEQALVLPGRYLAEEGEGAHEPRCPALGAARHRARVVADEHSKKLAVAEEQQTLRPGP